MTKETVIASTTDESKNLAAFLSNVPSGETVTYTDLNKVIGASVQTGKGKGFLETARRILKRGDTKVVFEVLRGVGLRRMENHEIIKHGAIGRKKIRADARRAITNLKCTNVDGLPDPEKMKYFGETSFHGVMLSMTTKKTTTTIEHTVQPMDKKAMKSVAVNMLKAMSA